MLLNIRLYIKPYSTSLHGIHDDSSMFFTSALVNSILYYMLILLHQQHFVVDGAISYVLLQISSLITYLINPFFSLFLFLQLVSTMLYLIITYISPIIVLLLVLYCLSLLAFTLPLSSILF